MQGKITRADRRAQIFEYLGKKHLKTGLFAQYFADSDEYLFL